MKKIISILLLIGLLSCCTIKKEKISKYHTWGEIKEEMEKRNVEK